MQQFVTSRDADSSERFRLLALVHEIGLTARVIRH